MKTTEITINSVKLLYSGLKGIEVTYLLPSIKQNRMFLDEYKSKRKSPIHQDLEDSFSPLKSHLLDICDYSPEQEIRDYQKENLSIESVTYGEKGFQITGKLNTLDGRNQVKLDTGIIADEIQYQAYGQVKDIIKNIFAETKEYLDGKKNINDIQLVLKANKSNNEFDVESFKNMSPTEQKDFATKILEDMGHMVYHTDEIITSTETDEEPIIMEEALIIPYGKKTNPK